MRSVNRSRAFARSGAPGRMGSGSRMGKQRGAVLIMSIIMLLAMTIAVMALINISSSQFQVINNMGEQKALEAAAREGIEIAVNSQELFAHAVTGQPGSVAGVGYDPASDVEVPLPSSITRGYEVTVSIPFCYGARTAPGYSALSAVAPEDTHWEIVSTARDPRTGAVARVVEGIKIRFGAGNCGVSL